MYSTWTGVLWLEPLETPIHTSGYSCSGATTISNSLTGLGSGKSKCCNRGGGKRENLRTVDPIWKPCWCSDFGQRKGTILHFLLAADLSGMYLNKHELVHWLVPLQQHHAGLQTATQKHATSLQVVSCRGRDTIKEQADMQSFVTAGHRFNPNYYKTCSQSAIQTSLTV